MIINKDIKYLSDLIEQYIRSLRFDKSKSTIEGYERSLLVFLKFAGDIRPSRITKQLINVKFVDYLVDEEKTLNYISVILQHVRLFLSYLRKIQIKTVGPKEIKDRDIKKSIGAYSNRYKGNLVGEREINMLANYWNNSDIKNLPRGIRNQVLIEILYNTGVTVTELTQIMREDIDLEKKLLRINFYKNKFKYKNRDIPINNSVVYWIKRYFDIREDKCQCLIVRFKAFKDYIVQAWPLTTKSMEDIVRETAENVGIAKNITPMVFRNSLIFKKIKQGKTMNYINFFFGYSSNTRRYYYSRYSDLYFKKD